MIIWAENDNDIGTGIFLSCLFHVGWVFSLVVSLFLMGLVLDFLFVKLNYLNLNCMRLHFPR
jgi:hypothetical protein